MEHVRSQVPQLFQIDRRAVLLFMWQQNLVRVAISVTLGPLGYYARFRNSVADMRSDALHHRVVLHSLRLAIT